MCTRETGPERGEEVDVTVAHMPRGELASNMRESEKRACAPAYEPDDSAASAPAIRPWHPDVVERCYHEPVQALREHRPDTFLQLVEHFWTRRMRELARYAQRIISCASAWHIRR